MKKQAAIALCLLASLSSCGVLDRSSKAEFDDGFYTQDTDTLKRKVYIDVQEDVLRIFPITVDDGKKVADTLGKTMIYPRQLRPQHEKLITFHRNSMDIDFLAIPLKFRPARGDMPAQLNAPISAALYLGYRTDYYTVDYSINPLHEYQREVTHYGLSFGLFAGIGNTLISPSTTRDLQEKEYDGVIFTKGAAVSLGLNNVTVGVAVGLDNLLDNNRSIWIYESRTWIGLAFGLNLN